MSCEKKIKKLVRELTNLDLPVKESLKLEADNFYKLVDLPANCSGDMYSWALDILNKIEKTNTADGEYFLRLLVNAMLLRKQENVDLIIKRVLLSDVLEGKEVYLSFLYDTDSNEKIEISLDVLRNTESWDELGGWDRMKIIEFLTEQKYNEAWSDIKECLTDVADRVRSSALDYFYSLGVNEEVYNTLLLFLFEEEDDELIKKAIGILTHWELKGALTALKKLGKEKWVQESPIFRDYLNQSINQIQQLA